MGWLDDKKKAKPTAPAGAVPKKKKAPAKKKAAKK